MRPPLYPTSFQASFKIRRPQRGVATLVLVGVLLMATTLVAVFTHASLATELRMTASQLRSTQAHEAAEAGLEWAIARLNDDRRIGDDCQPSTAPGTVSFRERHLQVDLATGATTPVTWDDAGTARPLLAACIRTDAGWACRCPAHGLPVLPAPTSTRTASAFRVALAAGSRPGVIRVVATGCTRSSSLCEATSESAHEAAARVEVDLARVPGLRSAPAAALTVRGGVDPGTAGLGLHNVDPGTGLALHAGGSLAGGALRLTGPAGSPVADSVVTGDADLAALSDERFFDRTFGMDRAAWAAQPAAVRLACAGSCTADIGRAVDAGASLIAVDGDLDLAGPVALGSPDRPVIVVASGAARLRGDVTLHGLLFARDVDWRSHGAPAGLVRGAVVASGNHAGDSAADIARDVAVLDRLKRTTGTFARIPGSWKDF